MPNSPPAVRRRILWIVILIAFMLALATAYMVLAPRRSARRISAIDLNPVSHVHTP